MVAKQTNSGSFGASIEERMHKLAWMRIFELVEFGVINHVWNGMVAGRPYVVWTPIRGMEQYSIGKVLLKQ